LPHPENALFPCSQKVEQKESMFDLYIKWWFSNKTPKQEIMLKA
jgi:hypothetical protein